jgi:hypothetical protein
VVSSQMEYKKRIPQNTCRSRYQEKEKENCILRSYNQRSTYDGMMVLNKKEADRKCLLLLRIMM